MRQMVKGRGRPKKTSIRAQTETGEYSKKGGAKGTVNQAKSLLIREKESSELSHSEDTSDLNEKEISTAEKSKEINNGADPKRNRGMKLNFVAPILKNGIPFACLDKKELEKEETKWEKAIILYVIGDSPSISYLSMFLEKQCQFVHKPEIYFHSKGYFVIRFVSMEDRDRILFGGPHHIANRPIIVKEWGMDFNFEKEILTEIPIWIQLPNLPLNCWSENSLSRIGSVLGKAICADECTTNQSRISFARMLVEIDVTQPLKYNISMEGKDGAMMNQKVYYEWVPPYCKKCQRVGHRCKETEYKKGLETKKLQQKVWQEKTLVIDKGKEKMTEKIHEIEQIERDTSIQKSWSIPKKVVPSPKIQVGYIHIPTQNVFEGIQEEETEKQDNMKGMLDPRGVFRFSYPPIKHEDGDMELRGSNKSFK